MKYQESILHTRQLCRSLTSNTCNQVVCNTRKLEILLQVGLAQIMAASHHLQLQWWTMDRYYT